MVFGNINPEDIGGPLEPTTAPGIPFTWSRQFSEYPSEGCEDLNAFHTKNAPPKGTPGAL